MNKHTPTPSHITPTRPATPLKPLAPAAPVSKPSPTGFVTLAQLQTLNAQIIAFPDSAQKTAMMATYHNMALTYESEEEAGTVAVQAPPQSQAQQDQIAESQREMGQ